MPLCPPEKEEAIKDAFRHFKMIWRLAALFGGRFFNTSLSEQYIHVGKYLFCMCNSPMLWISKCICHGHPWHWFHLWYLLECSWQSELYLLHHLLKGSMFLCLLPHDEHQQQTDYCPLRWNNSRHVFRGLRHLIPDIQWLQSFFLVPFLSWFLNMVFVSSNIFMPTTFIRSIAPSMNSSTSDFGTNLRLHDPLVFIEACQTTNAWRSFNQFSLA